MVDFSGFRINFFRPLPSLLHQIDYRLYGLNVQGWRVTTLALWLLLLWAVLHLYKELDGQASGVILLAGIFFAIDESHAWNTVWLAARHSLIAVLFVWWRWGAIYGTGAPARADP